MQIKINSFSVISFLLSTLFLFTGCTTMQSYDGPKLSPEKVVLIEGSFGMINSASILEVDGKARGWSEESAEMLPGEHTVKVKVLSGFGGIISPQLVGNKTLSFQTIAGRTYKVDGTIIKGDTFVWIIDTKTNEVIAGEKPK